MLINPTDKSKALKAQIISGSLVLLSGSTLATGINFAYNVSVARFLGATGFGHATAVYTLLTLTSAITLSFQITSAKVVAQQASDEAREAAYSDLHLVAWGFGLLAAILLYLYRLDITAYLNLPSAKLITLLAIGAAFYVPLGTRRGFIQGAYGFRKLAKNLVLEGAARLVGSLLMIALGFGVTGVIAANAAAMAIAYLAIRPKSTARAPRTQVFAYRFREILQAMVFFSGQVLINNCDIVLVKHFFIAEEAGLYAAIAMVGRVTFSFSSAIVNSMFPVVAGTKEAERKNFSLIATSLVLVLAVGGAFALVLRIAPAWIWTKFFGVSFHIVGPHGFPFLLALYAITTVIYSLSVVVITYEMAYKIANTSWVQLVFSGVVIAGICKFHASLEQVIVVQLILMIALFIAVAIPFLSRSLRDSKVLSRSEARPVRLVRRISEDEVIAEFIRSEFENGAYQKYHESLRSIVAEPNLEDVSESAKRRALLFLRHRALWKELPPDTEWYEIEVSAADLHQIRVFPRAQWRKIARGNFEVTKIVERLRSQERLVTDSFVDKIAEIRHVLSEDHLNEGSVLLIGLNESEPLTILDGNHRFVSAVLEGKIDRLRFLCGLSPRMKRCCWYRTDLFTLTRYGRNLLRHLVRHPEAELERLFEISG